MITVREILTRQEWLSWRDVALTASDVPAVAGIDPYRTALAVYAEKTGFDRQPETSLMRRGRMFEAAAVEYLRERHPDWRFERPNLFYLDEDERLGCTPDIFAHLPDGGIRNCQIKTVAAPTFEKWDGQAPIGYLLQTVCENMLVGAEAGILAVLVVSTYDAELHEFDVPRHAGAEERVREIARRFWANIAAGVAPAPDYQRDAEIIAKLKPPVSGTPPLDLTGDNRIGVVLEEYEVVQTAIKAAEDRKEVLKAEIIDKLDGAEKAVLDGWKISNTMSHRKEYVVPAKSYPTLRVARSKEAAA